jgi:hypothetical protein
MSHDNLSIEDKIKFLDEQNQDDFSSVQRNTSKKFS